MRLEVQKEFMIEQHFYTILEPIIKKNIVHTI